MPRTKYTYTRKPPYERPSQTLRDAPPLSATKESKSKPSVPLITTETDPNKYNKTLAILKRLRDIRCKMTGIGSAPDAIGAVAEVKPSLVVEVKPDRLPSIRGLEDEPISPLSPGALSALFSDVRYELAIEPDDDNNTLAVSTLAPGK